jgi:DNA-binding MarR family transcriptional regulator
MIVGEYPVAKGAEFRTALLLVRVGGVLAEIGDQRLESVGLDGRGYSILAILSVDDPESQFELAQLLGKAPGVIVAAIDELEQRGFVARTRDPADRRRSRVTLTTAGRRALRRADELADKVTADVLPGLDSEELAKLQLLLAKGLGLGNMTHS